MGYNNSVMQDEILTIDEAAALLKCNRKTIESAMALGMPALRINKRTIRLQKSDVLAWALKAKKIQ